MDVKRWNTLRWVGIVSLLVCAITIGSVTARADQLDLGLHFVAPGGDCGGNTPCYATLQAAVDAADPGDTVLVAGGTYLIPVAADQLVKVDKDLTILGGYTRDNWNTPDPLAHPVILDALGSGRVMVVEGFITVIVDGIHFENGDAAGLGGYSDGSDAGGGIFVQGANLVLSRVWVTDNAAGGGYGGGIYTHGTLGSLVLTSSVIQSNLAKSGAGIYLDSFSASLTGNIIQLNTGEDVGMGAGIALETTQAVLTANLVKGNAHGKGGGLAIVNSNVTLAFNTVNENESWSNGGGIYIEGSTAYLYRNLISENGASNGGGLDARNGSTLTLNSNTLLGNSIAHLTEGGRGGGANLVANTSGYFVLVGNLVLNNSAISGGGLYLEGNQSIKVNFNQVRGNAASNQGSGIVVAGSDVQVYSNFIQDNAGTNCVGSGLAIYQDAILTNNIITGNVCPQYFNDAGIYIEGASPRLYNNTIANNGSQQHIGVYVVNGSGGQMSQPELYNSIITNQSFGVYVDPSASGSQALLDHVLWWSNDHDTYGDVTVTNPLAGDPLYVSATDYHISAGSAAIGQGFDAGVPRDIDNQPRHVTPGLGADEFWAPGELKQIVLPVVMK